MTENKRFEYWKDSDMLKQVKPLHKLPKTINLVLKNGDVE